MAPDAAVTAVREEPISPELVLVSPELRARALDALLARDWHGLDRAARPNECASQVVEHPPVRRPHRSLPTQLLAYVIWQTLVGFLFAVAVVATVAVALVAVALAAR
jgi:hypothetical protein